MTTARRSDALRHLQALAAYPGYWELRALRRGEGTAMQPRGSCWFQTVATPDGLLFAGIDEALTWADHQDGEGSEIFVSVNPRSTPRGKTQRDVTTLTACFVDIDLLGRDFDAALAAVLGAELLPSLIVFSGHGLHVLYLLLEPIDDLPRWRQVQRALVDRFAPIGADAVPAPDSARVLRLAGYANRKDGGRVEVRLLNESDARYTLGHLAATFLPLLDDGEHAGGPRRSKSDDSEDHGLYADRQLNAEQLQAMVDVTVGTRAVLHAFVKQHMELGRHYGAIPGYDGRLPRKPTLLKAGAELIAILLGVTATFEADMAAVGLYGSHSGTFGYICRLADREGQVVGEGRGMAELREPNMYGSPNIALKMACKRAFVDAVLRVAGMSAYFTQDLEDPLPPAIAEAPPAQDYAALHQLRRIRFLLTKVEWDEAATCTKLRVPTLERLARERADRLIARLEQLATQQAATP